jgi:hypothetical protein
MLETVGLRAAERRRAALPGDATLRGLVVATNVFMRTPSGWRIVCHHASPAPAAESDRAERTLTLSCRRS